MTVSAAMQARLDKIEAHLNEHNLRVEKRYGFYPVLKSNSNDSVKPLPTRRAAGSGFSWIAFFFPDALCTQIREFSFFHFKLLSILLQHGLMPSPGKTFQLV